jgi:hypothetical protein
MTMTETTFGNFRRVLLGIGFTDHSVPGEYVRLENKEFGSVIVLRPYKDDEILEPIQLLGYSRILHEQGVIDRGRLDELLRERSLAG